MAEEKVTWAGAAEAYTTRTTAKVRLATMPHMRARVAVVAPIGAQRRTMGRGALAIESRMWVLRVATPRVTAGCRPAS